jgi:hypothetical protein
VSRGKVVASTVVVTWLVFSLLTAVTWVGLKALTAWGREEVHVACTEGTPGVDAEGFCVGVSRYPATPVHSERIRLEIARVVGEDHQLLDHRFVAPYPFNVHSVGHHGAEIEVDFSDSDNRIVVTEPRTGSTIAYTYDQYGRHR